MHFRYECVVPELRLAFYDGHDELTIHRGGPHGVVVNVRNATEEEAEAVFPAHYRDFLVYCRASSRQ